MHPPFPGAAFNGLSMKKTHSASSRSTAESMPAPRKPRSRKNQTTREAILEAAELTFAQKGYAGATVERISKQAKCYESLIYYHFGSKDKLFSLVLENAYRKLIEAEQALELDFDKPEAALRTIILFIWDYYQNHPELIILLNTENLHKGKHLKKIQSLNQLFSPAIEILQAIVESGVREKIFRADINVMNLYISIMSLGYFYVSNRYTLSAFLDKNLMAPEECSQLSEHIVDIVFKSVRK